MAGKLNAKQQAFVDEYVIDLNATQAAIRAGYSEKTAYSQGQRLLKHVEIQGALQEAMKAREERTHITQDQVLRELARIAFSDMRNLFDENGELKRIQDLDDATAAAVAAIETNTLGADGPVITTKVKLWDKMSALTNAMKHLGILTEKLDVNLKGLPSSVDEFV